LFADSKILFFFAAPKFETPELKEASGILVKFSEIIWWLEKMDYFCSPKFRE
jgi:hypothetical protein